MKALRTISFLYSTLLVAALALSHCAAAHAARDGLLLHLKLDEASGARIFEDASGNDHDARCGDGVPCPQATGEHGFFRLSATNWEWLEVPHSAGLEPGREMTVAVWIYPANAIWRGGRPVKIGGGKIVGKTNARFDGGWVLGTDVRPGQMKYSLYPEVWDSVGKQHVFRAGSFGFQEWTHLVLTWRSGGRMIGYVNGRKVKSISASSRPIGKNRNPLRVAIAPWDTNALAFGGGIDDLRLYDRTLSAGEIQQLFAAGRPSAGDAQEPTPPAPPPPEILRE